MHYLPSTFVKGVAWYENWAGYKWRPSEFQLLVPESVIVNPPWTLIGHSRHLAMNGIGAEKDGAMPRAVELVPQTILNPKP
jgi:hypothetical protein